MSPWFNGEGGPSGDTSVVVRRRNAEVIPRETPGGGS